jgi:hypothetical protein
MNRGHVVGMVVLALLLTLATGCAGQTSTNGPTNGSGEETGTVSLYLCDAPIDADIVEGVYITINEIQYNLQGEWTTFEDFEGPQEYDLLELSGGNSALLGNLTLPAGQYNQIRFMLDIPEQGPKPTNPGCYLLLTNSTEEPLFVPSGGTSGYKATGAFQVPVNGTVEITADFDVRKAVTVTGSGRYVLRPTVRLIVNDEAGRIGGSITNLSSYTNIAVYAYEDGTWDDSEADEPTGQDARFPASVTSAVADAEGEYMLAVLAVGTYDLVVAGVDGEEFGEVLGFVSDVVVESKKKTNQDIDTSALEADL